MSEPATQPAKEFLRMTPDEVERRADELEAAGWRVGGATWYGANDVSLLLVRDLPPPPPPRRSR